jgi:hypothetical protein
MAGAAGLGRATGATRGRGGLEAARAAADTEARDHLPDVGRAALGANDVLFFAYGHEALEPLAALLARKLIEWHFLPILHQPLVLVYKASGSRASSPSIEACSRQTDWREAAVVRLRGFIGVSIKR